VDAQLVVFNRYKLHSEADWSLDRRGGFARKQAAGMGRAGTALPRTDVFHFYFGLTLVPAVGPVPDPRALRKKSVMHYLGSDIRGKPPSELAYGKQAGAEVVGSYDAIRWVPEAEMIPPGIDVHAIEPSPPTDRTRPTIVPRAVVAAPEGHGARRRRLRGLEADLVLVEGLRHDEAFERYRDADIVVDQLNAGWYGVFAIECMALGKPVVTFLHDEAVARTERELGVRVPIVNATAKTLRERLEPLVASAAERQRIGAESRAYVEQVHDLERVADRLLALYARL
jgi:hypothetical protein